MYLNSFKKQLSKKQKRLFVTAIAVIAVGGLVGYKVYADIQTQKQVEQTQLLVNKQAKALNKLQLELQSLYSNEKPDFLSKDVTKETIDSLQDRLSKIIRKYATISSVKNVETSHYTNLLSDCSNLLKTVQDMLTTQEQVNGLFGKTVIVGDTVSTNVAIKDDLKADNVETAKNSYYKKDSKSEWQKAINTLLDQADEQLKQIEKAKQMLKKVFKDNKVISVDQENYESAKSEIDKIKNEKIKNELSENLKQVQNEINKQEKERLEKEKTEQTIIKEEIIVPSDVPIQNDSMNSQPVVSDNVAESSVPAQNETPINNWVPDTGNNSGTASNPATTPPANNGSGSTGGGANSSNSSSGNGQIGGNQENTTPTQPTVPSEPEQPAGPPAGWIVPPYPIGSSEFVDWLFDNGYSGYDHSGGYIRPY